MFPIPEFLQALTAELTLLREREKEEATAVQGHSERRAELNRRAAMVADLINRLALYAGTDDLTGGAP